LHFYLLVLFASLGFDRKQYEPGAWAQGLHKANGKKEDAVRKPHEVLA
jgi:hypothetical protein